MQKHKILIIEDEPKVAAFIRKGLEEHDYDTETAENGIVGKALALSNTYDLIILDINLPQLNGFQICKIIRENNINVPILMLTALGGVDDKIKGFEYGADDYLQKPFNFRELVLRIKALIKRTQYTTTPSEKICIADLEIDPSSRIVKRNGKMINLSAKEYLLLEYLAMNAGKIISRKELTEKIWGIKYETGSNVVDVFINFLRKKMDNDYNPKLIHTKIGMGYIMKEEK